MIKYSLLLLSLFVCCKPATPVSNSAAEPVSIPPYSLEELQKRTFRYFWDLAHPVNFQIPDRYPTLQFSSIAATGFGLSSYIIGIDKNYITRDEGAQRVLKTLQVLWDLPQGPDAQGVAGYKGFFYHFLTTDQALRYKQVELSSIDTGLLMAGVLSAMSYFDQENEVEKEIRSLADQLFRRVEWSWMMDDNNSMSMGYHPEEGFIHAKWKGYNEAMILLIMAMGSPTHPIQQSAWKKWCETYEWETFEGFENVQFDPLFGHQYSHIWIDFRGIQDEYMRNKGIDYFENSRRATLSNRAYCIRNPLGAKGYSENRWGLTACDGPADKKVNVNGSDIQFFSYRARGAAGTGIVDDGTIAPTAAGGSYPFAPEECDAALADMWNTFQHKLVDTFGFRDAFNLTFVTEDEPEGWFDVDYLGIDQGPILLMTSNYNNGIIWETMKKNPYILSGLRKAGFTGGWLDQTEENN